MKPCPSCLEALKTIGMRVEAVQPLPEGAAAPLGLDGEPQCHDCAAAGTLVKMESLDWTQARIVIANDRQEKLRLPGVPMGLPFVRPSEQGELKRHHKWLDSLDLEE